MRGNVATPLSLTVADLAKFAVHRVDDTRVVSGQGNEKAQVRQFAGCLLRDVLDAATWIFFRNSDKQRPSAFAVLDRKAPQLTGRDVDPQTQASPYSNILVKDRAADVFITYCTNAAAAVRREPQLKSVRIPDALNVGAVYGIGAAITATPGGAGFVPFALGSQGRAILQRFGFDSP